MASEADPETCPTSPLFFDKKSLREYLNTSHFHELKIAENSVVYVPHGCPKELFFRDKEGTEEYTLENYEKALKILDKTRIFYYALYQRQLKGIGEYIKKHYIDNINAQTIPKEIINKREAFVQKIREDIPKQREIQEENVLGTSDIDEIEREIIEKSSFDTSRDFGKEETAEDFMRQFISAKK